ncbi:MAG: HEAT repeat domain-containing protein [Salinibacter sp.]
MGTSLFSHIERLSTGTPNLLLILIWASAGLAALALGCALVAVGSRLWWHVQARRRATRTEAWRTQLLEVLAGERPPHTLVDQVPKTHRDAFLRVLLPYVPTVRGRAAERLKALARPQMPRLRRKLHSRWPLVRARAAQWIGLLGGTEQADVLRGALDDPSDQVADIAFRRLARLGGPADTERLLAGLDRLAHVDRRRISSALVELGTDAAPPLRAAMADDGRSPFVRVCCAETLRWLGDTAAAPVAARLLREVSTEPDATSPEVTASLLRLLRAVGQESHRSVVRRFCRSSVPFVRIHAARALGQLGTAADEGMLAALVGEDDSRWVALSAAQSLIDLGRTAPLRTLYDSDHRRSELVSNFLPAPPP